MMDIRPIGVFDSGIGGLTTVLELQRLMPAENIIYFGDTSRVPYGTRSDETIYKYARQDINFLLSKDVKMVIAACNTASAVLAGKDDFSPDFHFLEVISPTVEAAVSATKNQKIGVIATPATIKSKSYENELKKRNPQLEIISAACPLFVPLVENQYTNRDNKVTKMVAEDYLAPIKKAGVDTLILGCTHYPIIEDIIGDIMGKDVSLISSGKEVAAVARRVLEQNDMLNLCRKFGDVNFYASDSIETFSSSAEAILNRELYDNVEKIDIERY